MVLFYYKLGNYFIFKDTDSQLILHLITLIFQQHSSYYLRS